MKRKKISPIYLLIIIPSVLIFFTCKPTEKKLVTISEAELNSKYSTAIDSLNKNSPIALKLLQELKKLLFQENIHSMLQLLSY